jgi:hypothetical protein
MFKIKLLIPKKYLTFNAGNPARLHHADSNQGLRLVFMAPNKNEGSSWKRGFDEEQKKLGHYTNALMWVKQ